MILATIFSSLGGALLGFIPEVFKMFKDASDKKHELAVMQMQMQNQLQLGAMHLDEIGAQADITESAAIYQTYKTDIHWVDALNGTVRPVICYAFFALYVYMKWCFYKTGFIGGLWVEEDTILFAGIISFYFGNRGLSMARKAAR